MRTAIIAAIVCLALSGCVLAPLKGGRSRVVRGPNITETIQSQNPKDATSTKTEVTTESVLPAGTKIFLLSPDGTTNGVAILSEPSRQATTDRTETTIGASQKDVSREIGAKLASMRWIQWIGVVVFLFGVASAFYPPLRLVVGSTTTSAACAAAGLALTVLPPLIVGHEVLIFAVAISGVGLYWFAHRHGSVRGQLEAIKETLK
ncbi:MAG TPA: hypothetical protein VNU68_01255 [Verrucomicrobiae bacterium]|nr:hypothetical protein [Verrucomicrobiae bacterium]